MNRAFRACKSSTRGWLHRLTPWVCVPAPLNETAKPAWRAKFPPCVMGQRSGVPGILKAFVEMIGTQARASLFTALDGVSIGVEDAAALHFFKPRGQRQGRPARRCLPPVAGHLDRAAPSVRKGCTDPCGGGGCFDGREFLKPSVQGEALRLQSGQRSYTIPCIDTLYLHC